MRLSRSLFLSILETAEPALGSAKNQVQGLAHFWFDGKSVTAFNDILGIRVDFNGDFTGGVEGERLLGILKNSHHSSVCDLQVVGDGQLKLQVASTEVVFPLLDIKERLFNQYFPDGEAFKVSAEFKEAIKLALLSVGSKKIAAPSERGVTLIQEKDSIDAFSTDEVTVSWMNIKDDPDNPKLFNGNVRRAIWSKDFCEYFVKTMIKGSDVIVTQDAVYCVARIAMIPGDIRKADERAKVIDGKFAEVMVFSRLVEDDDPANFTIAPTKFAPAIKEGFGVPPLLKQALDRAAVMMPSEQPVDVEVMAPSGEDPAALRLYSSNAIGEFDDQIDLEPETKHKPISVKVDVGLLKRSITGGQQKMAVINETLVLSGPPNFYHFISTRN